MVAITIIVFGFQLVACKSNKNHESQNSGETSNSDSINTNANKSGSNSSSPKLDSSTLQGINLTDKDIEGYYQFQFRISSWNWSCIDKDGNEKFRIKDGVPQEKWGAAYGWYYKLEKVDGTQYKMIRYMNKELDQFDDEYQNDVNVEIKNDGSLNVEQTFEYGVHYVNTQETIKMNGTFTSENEIKGNYLEFSEVKTGNLKSCTHKGEYTMTKKGI